MLHSKKNALAAPWRVNAAVLKSTASGIPQETVGLYQHSMKELGLAGIGGHWFSCGVYCPSQSDQSYNLVLNRNASVQVRNADASSRKQNASQPSQPNVVRPLGFVVIAANALHHHVSRQVD